MKQETARTVLKLLNTYYPLAYPDNMDSAKAMGVIKDICESFGKYKDEAVTRAYTEWHRTSAKVPTIADIKPLLRHDDLEQPTGAELWTDYFEDEDGYGYAKSTNTGEYNCIWKPWWSKDRTVTIKGEEMFFAAKNKGEVLKAHGISVSVKA